MAKELSKIGFFSNATSVGGTETYLWSIMTGWDFSKLKPVFYCNAAHPFLKDSAFNDLVQKQYIQVVKVFDDSSSDSVRQGDVNNVTRNKGGRLAFFWRQHAPSSWKFVAGFFKEVVRLRRIFLQNPVVLLSINEDCSEPVALAAYLARIPIRVGILHLLPRARKGEGFQRLTEWCSTRLLTRLISVSKATKDNWVQKYNIDQGKIKVIYNGVNLSDPKFLTPRDRTAFCQELDIASQDPWVVLPGRLHWMKGHKYLLEAVPLIIEKCSKAKFLFVGEGAEEGKLRALVSAMHIESHVKFLGYRTDIVAIIGSADLVVLPSIAYECLPYVLIEAQACKKAIVASDIGGISEIVKNNETGILVPPKSSLALSQAIIELLNDPAKAQRMGEAGRKRTETMFTLEKMLMETFSEYESLLDKKSTN